MLDRFALAIRRVIVDHIGQVVKSQVL